MQGWSKALAVLLCLACVVGGSDCFAELHADVQYLFVTPSIPSQGFDNIYYENAPAAVDAEGTFDGSTEFAMRFQLELVDDFSDFGARVRWFTFDNDFPYTGLWDTFGVSLFLTGSNNLDVDAVDFEITQHFKQGYWDFLGCVGLRYGRVALSEIAINFEDAAATVYYGQTGLRYEGFGPTLALEARRRLGCTGLALFAAGRSAVLFGDAETYSPFRVGGRREVDEETVCVWELQTGIEHTMRLTPRMTFESGVFFEAQHWHGENNTVDNLSFVGVGIHTGLNF